MCMQSPYSRICAHCVIVEFTLNASVEFFAGCEQRPLPCPTRGDPPEAPPETPPYFPCFPVPKYTRDGLDLL